MPGVHSTELYDPREIQERSKTIPEERLRSTTLITDKVEGYLGAVGRLVQHGFTHVSVSNWGPAPEEFFEFCRTRLIPRAREAFGAV